MRLNQPLKTPISFMTLSRQLTIIIVLTRSFRSICFTLYTQSSYQILKICGVKNSHSWKVSGSNPLSINLLKSSDQIWTFPDFKTFLCDP